MSRTGGAAAAGRALALTAALAAACGLAGAAQAASAAPLRPAACPAAPGLAGYIEAMDDEARQPLARVAAVPGALERLPAARETAAARARWASAGSAVDVAAQAIDKYVEDAAPLPAPAGLTAVHAALGTALIGAFQGAAPLRAALEVGDGATVAQARRRWAAAARALLDWKRAVTAAAAKAGVALPAWMQAPGPKPRRAC